MFFLKLLRQPIPEFFLPYGSYCGYKGKMLVCNGNAQNINAPCFPSFATNQQITLSLTRPSQQEKKNFFNMSHRGCRSLGLNTLTTFFIAQFLELFFLNTSIQIQWAGRVPLREFLRAKPKGNLVNMYYAMLCYAKHISSCLLLPCKQNINQ